MFDKTEDTSCENCKYYFMDQCRRNPPSSNGNPWPVVMPKDWCGEFLMSRKSKLDESEVTESNKVQSFLNGWYLE